MPKKMRGQYKRLCLMLLFSVTGSHFSQLSSLVMEAIIYANIYPKEHEYRACQCICDVARPLIVVGGASDLEQEGMGAFQEYLQVRKT